MTHYNVEMDDVKWATTKVDLTDGSRNLAMLEELIRRNPNTALRISSAIDRWNHGQRVAARVAQNC